MRAMGIKQEEGYIGPYQALLKPEDAQQIVFGHKNVGPCWMTPEEREAKQKDKILPRTKVRNFIKKELLENLKEKNITYKGNQEGLRRVAANNRIPVCEEIQKKNINTFQMYTLKGKEDHFKTLTCSIAFLTSCHPAQIWRKKKQFSKPWDIAWESK